MQFYGLIESTLEMSDEKHDPLIGDLFEEMVEVRLLQIFFFLLNN